MAVSLNSVISFNPVANYQQVTRSHIRVLSTKVPCINSLSGFGLFTNRKKSRSHLLADGGDNIATETSDNDSKSIDESYSKNGSSDIESGVATNDQNGGVSSESGPKTSSPKKRAPLTARERLRAARVLSRYTDANPSKREGGAGNKLLDVLQESDVKGKKLSGLPQAPTNLFDDSKRGMPKSGWTFDFPGGIDVFFIALSFVVISSVMFATTFLVWKVGAIHFNEL